MGAHTECWSRDGPCRGDEDDNLARDIGEREGGERDDIVSKTHQIHVKRITGFITGFPESPVADQDGAPNLSARHREGVSNLSTPQRNDMGHDHASDADSPFYNSTLGDMFGLLDCSSESHQTIANCHGVVVRRRASTSLLSEDLERLSSRMKTEEKSNFETQMSKLKSLSIRKESEMDATHENELSRTLSCRGLPGELRVLSQKKKTHKTHHCKQQQQQQSPGTAGSSGSEAMPIPYISRACTAPDQLPELSSSMLESLLLDREKEEKKNKSPKGTTLATPNGEERRTHVTGRRVPSVAFLDDLAALQERQYSVFRNDSEKRKSTRHHLYCT